MVSKRGLAVALSELEGFAAADIRLEQYTTDSEIAAQLLWEANMRGLIEGKKVIDLGAGTGILAIGAALLGAASVTAVEKDKRAIEILQKNKELFEGTEEIRIREEDVASCTETGDLVIMNPPFGTKERHADKAFLEKARELAPAICTMHKSSTRAFVHAYAKEWGLRIDYEKEVSFPLKRSMGHHAKERQQIEVTLYILRA